MILCFTVFIVLVLVGGANGGHALYASSHEIEELWETEAETIQHMRDVLESIEEFRVILSRYVASWETFGDSHDGRARPGDPAATFALLRHVAEGWKEVDITLSKAKDLYTKIEHLATRPDREPLPNNDDVLAASEAFAKLAHVYRFNTSALERGLFVQGPIEYAAEDVRTGYTSFPYPLSVGDLASIGLAAINKGYFNVGVEFLRAARLRVSTHHAASDSTSLDMHPVSHFSLQKIESLLNTAVKVHNHVLDVRGPRSLTHATAATPYSNTGYRDTKSLEKEIISTEEDSIVIGGEYLSRHDNKTWMLNHRALVEQQQIERLCRGEDLRTVRLRSTLSCSYLSSGSPWLLLAPFKMEVVSLDPHIAVIYEVMTVNESKEVRNAPHLDLHIPHNAVIDSNENVSAIEWSLKHVWLESRSIPALQQLNLRLAHLAHVNLDDTTSEPFMVANYGIGGEYGPHRDTHGPSKRPPNRDIGERLSTMVVYMQAPHAGGRLVFPWVGVGVDAVNGAAVIWWNLLSSHEHDFLTRHAACPVLRGHKWILTKWVGYNAQWNMQPCPLDPSRKISTGTFMYSK